ncbi:E3 ubiquitin-protein ligase ZSWIM2 [Kryptolebias marmoratus]|uniref:E3 ubiquitin-protein ligase ZSWIM2 n=1 Tax=Kryptolebias marmoratus TaxID=37003 RepID=UPI0018ACE619|nr:E3 ubiquitin-protein ligase ZSWIM2 [Kryptolebias marmoratus]
MKPEQDRMLRRTGCRNTASDAVRSHQDQALDTTMFLIRSCGPAAFLLRENGEARDLKVCLGDPHTCSCSVFSREREPCKHICWVLLRKFRLPREHEYSFQPGLVERQLLELLQGLHRAHRTELDASAASGTLGRAVPGPEAGSVCRKVIQAQDVCPICQEELLQKKQPVSYCRFGCGNSVHISCMKVWADHQTPSDQQEMVRCPLCREDFCSVKLLQEQVKNAAKLFTAAERERANKHLGAVCHSCRVCPVSGTCFRCAVCSRFYLCEECVQKGCHSQHPLASRATRRAKWVLVAADPTGDPKGATSEPQPDGAVAELSPSRVLERLPAVRVRPGSQLLNEGLQCRICLQGFSVGQTVRTLPCHHKFHVDCVDQTLLETNSCPLDGFIIYGPLTWRTTQRKTCPTMASSKQQENNVQDLFVPGVALQVLPPRGALNFEVPTSMPQKDATAAGGERQTRAPFTAESGRPLNHDICSRSSKQRAANMAAAAQVREQRQVSLSTESELRMTGVSVNAALKVHKK